MNDVPAGEAFARPLALSSPELRALLDHIEAGAAERESRRILPHAEIALIRQARLGALRLAEDGVSFPDLFKFVIALGAADANVAHILRNHFTAVEFHLRRRPREGQRRKWYEAVAQGAIIGLAMAEQDSPRIGAVVPRTALTPDGEGYRLNGTKFYCTGTIFADLVQVRAATPDGAPVSVLIPTDREGIEIVDDWDGAGQRLTGSGTTNFRDVRVEAAELIFDSDEPGQISHGSAYNNTQAQLFVTAVNAGILEAIRRDAVRLVQARQRPFYYAPATRPADDPILQQIVGRIASDAFAARAVVLAAAQALDEASRARDAEDGAEDLALDAAIAAAQAKILVDEFVQRAGGALFDVGGASSTRRSLNLDRHWRNARTLASHNPAAYKAQAIGDWELNATPLPSKGFF